MKASIWLRDTTSGLRVHQRFNLGVSLSPMLSIRPVSSGTSRKVQTEFKSGWTFWIEFEPLYVPVVPVPAGVVIVKELKKWVTSRSRRALAEGKTAVSM